MANIKLKNGTGTEVTEVINHYTLFTEKYNNYIANNLLAGNKYSKELTFNDKQ